MKIRQAKREDLKSIYQIEVENFSQNEQISQTVIESYIQVHASVCFAIEEQGRLVAYLLVTPTQIDRVTDSIFEEIRKKEPDASYLAIASLSVASSYKGCGVGSQLLAHLKESIIAQGYKGISLTCHEELISYYEKNGFVYRGVSESILGGEVWHDMYWESLSNTEILAF